MITRSGHVGRDIGTIMSTIADYRIAACIVLTLQRRDEIGQLLVPLRSQAAGGNKTSLPCFSKRSCVDLPVHSSVEMERPAASLEACLVSRASHYVDTTCLFDPSSSSMAKYQAGLELKSPSSLLSQHIMLPL